MKDSGVIFLKDWKPLVSSLSIESQIYFWELFTSYEYGVEQKCDNEFVKPIWNFIKSQLDKMKEKYNERIVERNRANGSKGGRPRKPRETDDTPKNPLGFSETQKTPKDNENGNDNINKDYTLINQIEPKGFDSLHFTIAKMFHSLFVKLRGETKTLQKVKTEKYVNTIRLLLEKDKISVTQLAALKLYLEDSKKEGSKLNSFWADTIFSVDSFRGKAKNGTERWDLICLELKKWQTIEGNVQRAQKLTETINTKAKDYDRIQEGV